MTHLLIRYANPDTTPSQYRLQGWLGADVVITDGYWTLRGPEDLLRLHVQRVLQDNDLNDYRLVQG